MDIGYTGPREGMTEAQEAGLRDLVARLKEATPAVEYWAHHGDCVGGDAKFHDLAVEAGYQVWIHPPIDPKLRAFKESAKSDKEQPYLDRNYNMVDAVEVLLSTPDGPEKLRSGTWSTIRYARRQGKTVVLIWPDGRVQWN